jgi:hypothetical protein
VDDGRLLHVLWQAAESVSMAPALLELLLSHGRLPPSEPMAEFFFFFSFFGEESLHAHRCQSYQQFERQIKQPTEEFRVHSTSYDKGSCFAMA